MPETPDRPKRDDPTVIAAHRAALVACHVERPGAVAQILAEHENRLGLDVIGVEKSRTGRGIPLGHHLADRDRVLENLW